MKALFYILKWRPNLIIDKLIFSGRDESLIQKTAGKLEYLFIEKLEFQSKVGTIKQRRYNKYLKDWIKK